MSSNPSQPSSVFLYTQTTVENEGTETTQAQTVVPRSSHRLAPHADFIQFLALCQKLKTPFRLLDRHDGLDSLGEGGQGAISQSLYNSDISFAYKRTTLAGTAQDTETREGLLYDIWTTELWVLQKLSIVKHPNLVALQGLALEVHVETPGQTDRFSVQPVLMFEKAKYGSLPNFMRTNREWIPWEIRVHICASIGMAVAILHELGVVHSDLKPENILMHIDKEGLPTPKVIDFGFSRVYTNESERWPLARTVGWNAPEWHPSTLFSFEDARRCDIFSWAKLCFWILFGIFLDEPLTHDAEVDLFTMFPAPKIEFLRTFSTLCLIKQPLRRLSQIAEAIDLFQAMLDLGPVAHIPAPRLATFIGQDLHGVVQLEGYLFHYLYSNHFLVRKKIVSDLEQKLRGSCKTCSEAAALQLAFCLEYALGCARNTASSDSCLQNCGYESIPQQMIESTEKYCRNPWSYNFANPSIRGRGPGGGGFGILYARAKIGPQALAFLTLEADGKSNRRDGLAQVSYRIVRDRLASTLAFFDHHLEALKVHEERLMLVQQDDKLDAQERDGECLLIRHEIAECMWKSNSFSLRKAALKEQRGISREAESRYGSDSAFVCRAKMKILKMSLMEKDPSLDEETQRIYESLLQTFQTNDRGRHRLRIIALQNEYAYYLYTRGREREDLDLGDKATAIQEEAYALQVRIYGEDNDQSMTALNNLVSMIAISTNAKSRAHEIIEKSRKIFTWRQKHLGNSHHRTLQAMDNLSLALQEHGDINEALSLILLSIETRIPLIRIGDMDDKQMRSTLTLMRDAVGLLEKDTDEGRANSQNFLKKAIASMSRFEHSNPAGNEYWDVMNYYRQEYAKALRNMAKQHEAHREFDKSIPLRQEALNETLRIEEECRHYVKDHWRGLAQAYFRSGKRFLDPRKGQSADESFTRALDLLCIHESPTADETLGMRRQIAHLLEDHEQHWKAALLRRENLVLLLEQGTETGAIAQAAESLVGTLAGQAKRNLRYREYEAAILLLAECVDVASTHLGRTHQVTFVCRGKLAGAHSQAGNADMAVSIMNAAAIDAREVEDINPGLTKQLQDFLTKMRDRHGQNVEVTK